MEWQKWGSFIVGFIFFAVGLFSGSGAAGGGAEGAIINFKNAFVAGVGSSVISYGLIRLLLVFVEIWREASVQRRASTAPPANPSVKNAVVVSLAAPVLVLLGAALGRPFFLHKPVATLVVVILSALVSIGGLCSGIYGFTAGKRFNPRGVFGPALFGIILGGRHARR